MTPDACLNCRDGKSIPNCSGLCPPGYTPTPMRHFFCNNPFQNYTNNKHIDKMFADDISSNAIIFEKERFKRSLRPESNEIPDDKIKTKSGAKKYGGKAGPLRLKNQETKVGKGQFACVDADGNVEKMKKSCSSGTPVCADGLEDDLCIGCSPNSYYICKGEDVADLCPPGFILERTPLKFCLQFKIRCPTEDGSNGKLTSPLRCPPDSEPVCMSTQIPGMEWPIHPCGCGPHAEPYCSGPQRPGLKKTFVRFHEKK